MSMRSVVRIILTPTKQSVQILAVMLVVVALFVPSYLVAVENEIYLNDGLPLDEQIAIQDAIANASGDWQCQRSLLIVDSTKLVAFWGIYRFSQLTPPGWDLFGRTVDWALDHKAHGDAKIWLATYNGTLDPDNRDADGLAAYRYLIDSMGILTQNIEVRSQSSLETDDFTGYDLLIYANTYAHDVQNILNQDIPFITVSVGQTLALGIGTGAWVLHDNRNYLVVTDEVHEITSPYNPGLLTLQETVWENATYAAGRGKVLVVADTVCYYPNTTVRISSTTGDIGSTVEVDISLESVPGWFQTGGFDLLISYDTTIIQAQSVTQGQLLSDCGWEFFNASIDAAADCGLEPCNNGAIRIVGVADQFSVPGSPTCNISSEGVLATISFSIINDTNYICRESKIKFVWFDCGDNSFSSIAGDSLFVSQRVGAESDFPPAELEDSFPTFNGLPDSCIQSGTTARRLTFIHGSVSAECPNWSPNENGDVNLNEIEFEIADVVLFSRYLVYGLSAFNINTDAQIEETDANNDGITLSLDDYVFMWRFILGEYIPIPSPPPVGDTAFFVQDIANKTIKLNYPGDVHAVYLIFEGDLQPWGWVDSTRPYDGTYTRVLMDVYSSQDSTLFTHDSILFYTGNGALVGAFASYDGRTPIPTTIIGSGVGCCTLRGDANNSGGDLVDITDLVFLIEYVLRNGPAPPCLEEADIVPNWSVDIVDITAFVDYMFRGGAAPPPCQ